ncbi:MAG TPA: permease-like cell division protein FtsX [Acidimicrobiales bacterium]|jgi:cell division transport system permease protein|nr:permease-like cell division protein FtsX [Acidimicrobiales bacterium]
MPISLRYVSRETATNLWRNRLMALAAILTVGVSLSLVGTALLLRQAVNDQLRALNANVNLQIFVNADASNSQTAAIAALIHETPQISRTVYLDHQQSYANAVRLFRLEGDSQDIISSLTVASTPPVFECTLTHAGDAAAVASLFTHVAGVYQVTYPGKSIHELQEVSNVLQAILLVLALVLLISAVVLILNAIRMAIFARRKEVGVMRLVGATAWFIRLPFMVEGLIQGIIGAGIAASIVLLGDIGIRDLLHHFQEFKSAIVPNHDVIVTEIFVVLFGIVVGVVGSAVAVRRFLDA